MKILLQKGNEVIKTLLPVVILVLLLTLTIVQVESDIFVRFVIGSVLLLIGLSFFLWGIDLSMNTIGELMAGEVATSKHLIKILAMGFLLGFLITVAEPDLLILGLQIETASGHTMSAMTIVYVVSAGVGVTVAFGVLRLLKERMRFNTFMAIIYGIIFILALFVSEEFLAIAFDASGATTGALTTPFALALTFGLSSIKGGKRAEENAFGLVGVMSAGPILAVMLLSIITGQKHIQSAADPFVIERGIIGPLMRMLPVTLKESFIALLPISIFFFLLNAFKFKIGHKRILSIIGGLLLTLTGLVLFLTGVNTGFLEMGRIIGMQVAAFDRYLLIVVGFFLGMIVVLMEPAVHVLGEQIEEVTAGHIPVRLIRITLSGGVAIAIALSMVRIVFPSVHLWYFLIPGFIAAVIFSFFSDQVFVGIAYDAGGVASGPMTATFVLAFAQGAASMIPTADVMRDGFGVIAMVAMAPVLSLNILGTYFAHKQKRIARHERVASLAEERYPAIATGAQVCILVDIPRGLADEVVALARSVGATGATILHGRGGSSDQIVKIPLIGVEVLPEREMVLLVTDHESGVQVSTTLSAKRELDARIFATPTEALVKELPPNHA
ncbi:MAG: DUF1538 domain-containing protein [Spirochaetales bacterium]|jgi:hypothetical protein|nr:DUF1538 domain-containing protein [Spirochaetales bacterium]